MIENFIGNTCNITWMFDLFFVFGIFVNNFPFFMLTSISIEGLYKTYLNFDCSNVRYFQQMSYVLFYRSRMHMAPDSYLLCTWLHLFITNFACVCTSSSFILYVVALLHFFYTGFCTYFALLHRLLYTWLHLLTYFVHACTSPAPTPYDCPPSSLTDSRFAPSQWETPLHNNVVSHWLAQT